jgi:hypothetical protein
MSTKHPEENVKKHSLLTSSVLALLAVSFLAGCSPKSSNMTISPAPSKYIPPPQDEKPEFEKPNLDTVYGEKPKVEQPNLDTVYGEKPKPPEIPTFDKVPDQKFDWVYEDGGQRQLELKPQVDILFVVDNSDSMRSAQANLVRNIDKFSAVIGRTQMIDYHIGVISVWDYSKRFTDIHANGAGLGELHFVKDSQGQSQKQRFVTRQESPMLASTLNIGVQAYKDGGPEVEEFFAPVAAALEKAGNGAPNDGFFRPEAQLVVIFMTDADEQKEEYDSASGVTRLSVGELYDKLVNFKAGDKTKVSAYGVLVPTNAPEAKKDFGLRMTPKDHPECFDIEPKKAPKLNGSCPKAFGPDKLEKFVLTANSNSGSKDLRSAYIKDITAPDFGNDLTAIGAGITKKTMAKVIYLSHRPMFVKYAPDVQVFYGTQEDVDAGKAQMIPFSPNNGWSYDVKQNAVVLSGDIKYQNKANARYIVRMHVAPVQ